MTHCHYHFVIVLNYYDKMKILPEIDLFLNQIFSRPLSENLKLDVAFLLVVAIHIKSPFDQGNENARALIQKVLNGEEVEIQVTIQEDHEDDGYFVSTDPILPIFTDGDTLEETRDNFQEAFELFFEEEMKDPKFDIQKIKIIYFQKLLLA